MTFYNSLINVFGAPVANAAPCATARRQFRQVPTLTWLAAALKAARVAPDLALQFAIDVIVEPPAVHQVQQRSFGPLKTSKTPLVLLLCSSRHLLPPASSVAGAPQMPPPRAFHGAVVYSRLTSAMSGPRQPALARDAAQPSSNTPVVLAGEPASRAVVGFHNTRGHLKCPPTSKYPAAVALKHLVEKLGTARSQLLRSCSPLSMERVQKTLAPAKT